MMRRRGDEVLTTTTVAEALEIMRKLSFDALVMDCAQDRLDIVSFTARAHGLQPSLAVFLADEWGDELATGLEELTHLLTMLEDDEFAMLKGESLMTTC
jgi:DNA-binding response OmpR family regulator